MPNLDEMKDKANQAAEDMKNRSGQQSGQPGQPGQQPAQPGQQPAQHGQQTGQQTIENESDEDDMQQEQSGGMMDKAKKRMDVNEDGKFDAEDLKKMGQDGAGKVKGMFKKES